jgi:hypothetical protein
MGYALGFEVIEIKSYRVYMNYMLWFIRVRKHEL